MHWLYNSEDKSEDWVDLNVQQNFNQRQIHVNVVDYSRIKTGIFFNQQIIVHKWTDRAWLAEFINGFIQKNAKIASIIQNFMQIDIEIV